MKKIIILFIVFATIGFTNSANAQEGYIGDIKLFGSNFAPRNWALCQGQLLPIAQNTALFSILGTTYGGDGRTTFALPDLRGRTAIHEGNGPGLSSITLGEKGGKEYVQFTKALVRPLNGTPGTNIATSNSQVSIVQPSLGLNYIICLQGLYPSRSKK